MLSGYQTEEELIQNMVDAGCGETTVAGVLACLKQGQKKKGTFAAAQPAGGAA